MATRAPFGTDLQPEHDVKLLGGKLVHVAREKPPSNTLCGNTTATRIQRQIKLGGRHFPKRLLSVVTEEESGAQPYDKQLLYWPDTSPEQDVKVQDNLDLPELHTDRSSRSSVNQPARPYNPSQRNRKKHQAEDGLVTAARKLKSRTIFSILDPAMSLVRNKQRVLEDIFGSCKRQDYQQLGVLNKPSTLKAFRSFGVKINETDFTKLVDITDCAVGEDHIRYSKLYKILLRAATGESSHLDEALKKADTIQTPYASIESHSPGSVEEFELSAVGLNFSKTPLTDKTNHPQAPVHNTKEKNMKWSRGNNMKGFRMAQTQPAMRKGLKLPPLVAGSKLSHTTPLVSPTAEGGVWHPLQKPDLHDGMERLKNALLSCSDSRGQIECEQAHRTIRNYSLIYSLELPLEEVWQHIVASTSRSHRGGYCTSVHQLLEYLAASTTHTQ